MSKARKNWSTILSLLGISCLVLAAGSATNLDHGHRTTVHPILAWTFLAVGIVLLAGSFLNSDWHRRGRERVSRANAPKPLPASQRRGRQIDGHIR